MSQQITCTVDDSLKDWLEAMSDDLGISEAEVQRRCFRVVRQDDEPRSVLQPFNNEGVSEADIREELDAIRERVSALEDDGQDGTSDESAQRAAARSHNAESVDADWVSEHGDWNVGEHAETPTRNEAIADAYQRLRDAGSLETSDLLEVHADHDLDYAESTYRKGTLNVLATLPHVSKPRSGQSTWHYTDDE